MEEILLRWFREKWEIEKMLEIKERKNRVKMDLSGGKGNKFFCLGFVWVMGYGFKLISFRFFKGF